jgi:hypothetical protein
MSKTRSSREIARDLDRAFEFTPLLAEKPHLGGVRRGYAILVSDGRGGRKPWGGQLFQDLAGANMTAARCLGTQCDIVPAREIWRTNGSGRNTSYVRNILVDA